MVFFQLGKVVSLTLNNFSVKASIKAKQYQFIPVIALSLRFKTSTFTFDYFKFTNINHNK